MIYKVFLGGIPVEETDDEVLFSVACFGVFSSKVTLVRSKPHSGQNLDFFSKTLLHFGQFKVITPLCYHGSFL